MTLPFEVTYSEKPSRKSKNMKRLAVIIRPESLDEIISSLKEMGLDATIYDVKRATEEKKERVASARGSGTFELAYTTRKIVATVVNSDNVDGVAERTKIPQVYSFIYFYKLMGQRFAKTRMYGRIDCFILLFIRNKNLY